MRHILLLLLLAFPAAADDLIGPAGYLKILSDSKLRYNVVSEPSKTPAEEKRCARRDLTMRVIGKGEEKSLVRWDVKPAAAKLLDEAEVLFAAKKYAEAGEKYRQAGEADPEAVRAWFGYGDTLLFGAKDPAAALEQYRKAIALDTTLPLGHFFASTAYTHLGQPHEAREAIIKALTLHPAYEAIWDIAGKNPATYGIRPVVRHRFEPPAGYLGAKQENGIDIYGGVEGAWLGYSLCKAVWANEPEFTKQRSSAPGLSPIEERACVTNQVLAAYNATEAKLSANEKKRGVASPKIEQSAILAALPPLERHLFEVAQAKMIDGYILFEIIGQRCPMAMSVIDDATRAQIEQYIRRFVIVPAN